MSKDIQVMAEELYSTMIEKLHRHYVVNKSDISVTTALQIVSAIHLPIVDAKEPEKAESFIEEEQLV